MNRYDRLDSLIIQAIRDGRSTSYCSACQAEARLWAAVPNNAWRLVDRRQQALRRAGKIQYVCGPDNKKRWEVIE